MWLGARALGCKASPTVGNLTGTTTALCDWGLVSSAQPIQTLRCSSGSGHLHTSCVQAQTLGHIYTPPPCSQCALFLGIYESDDVSAIVSEMEKALNYSQKVCCGRGRGQLAALASVLFLGCHTECHGRAGLKQQTFVVSLFQRLEV